MNLRPKNKFYNVVFIITAINVLCFMLQLIPGFTDLFLLTKGSLFNAPWRILTHMFLHNDLGHLFINSYVLLMFGSLVERKIGSKKFLTAYLVSGLLAGLFASFFYNRALGASGAIMGIVGLLIILIPNLRILFFFVIPMPLWVAGIVIAIMDAVGILFPSNVGNIAHLAGLAVGLLLGYLWKTKTKKFNKGFQNKSHLSDNDIDNYIRNGRF